MFNFNKANIFQFFVASDPTVKDDRLWREKYTLRKSMVPTFLTTPQATKVNVGHGCHGTGKTINSDAHFPDMEITWNLSKNIKSIFLHREFTFNTVEIFKF